MPRPHPSCRTSALSCRATHPVFLSKVEEPVLSEAEGIRLLQETGVGKDGFFDRPRMTEGFASIAELPD
jgi:hypothetical protein